jgi:ferric enterobactin receptor
MNTKIATVKFLLCLCCISIVGSTGSAQTMFSDITIKGNLVDSVSKNSIPFATIKLLDRNELVIKVALANKEGAINFLTPVPARAFLFITATGYQSLTISIKVDTTKDAIELGTILLAPHRMELKEVVIIAKAPVIRQEADRIIYNTQADPDSKTKNTLEIMRKIPYLSVDAEENLLLKGNRNYKIFINGKPSGLMESNPKEVLGSIPASTIQRIEIITTPSAKYDAEGVAGIINIVTIKKMSNGYNGSVNLYDRMPMTSSGLGVSFTTKKGKWGFSGYSGINYNKLLPTEYTHNQVTDNFSLLQKGQKKSTSPGSYLGINISYEIDSLNLLTAQGSINRSDHSGNDLQAALLNNGGTTQQYKTINESNAKARGMDAGINWQIGSKANKSRLVTFSYQYIAYSNKQDNRVELSEQVNYLSPNFRQYNKGSNREHAIQMDLVQSFKDFYFEAGVKGVFRNNNSDFEYLKQNTISGFFETDSMGTNQFLSSQNMLGVYNNYRFSIKSYSFQAGFRIEQTFTSANFITNGTAVTQNYFNVIPSISINKELKNKDNLNIGFSQRIKRPGINRLNPFVDRSNPNFESTGNPKLRPVLNNDLLLGYSRSKKISYTIGISYSFSTNIDLKVSTYNPVSKITTTVFQNTGNASRLGMDYNLNYPVNENLNVGLNGNLAYFWINGFAGNKPIKNNMLTYYFALSAEYHFKHNWQIHSDLNVLSQNPSGLQSKSNGLISSSFSISKNLLNNKLSFSGYVNNPFAKFRNNISQSFGYNFEQTFDTKEYFRAFGFRINYKFGKLNEDVKKNKRAIRNDDVAN